MTKGLVVVAQLKRGTHAEKAKCFTIVPPETHLLLHCRPQSTATKRTLHIHTAGTSVHRAAGPSPGFLLNSNRNNPTNLLNGSPEMRRVLLGPS